ncbi:hypothetical protein INR49_000482 [Caranx melampygus]|nr:hypothetical protein INR49_000482 [Caranx melampygus]
MDCCVKPLGKRKRYIQHRNDEEKEEEPFQFQTVHEQLEEEVTPDTTMGPDCSVEHQSQPQFKQVCSCNNHYSVHLSPFLFTAPPSALGIMSKSH